MSINDRVFSRRWRTLSNTKPGFFAPTEWLQPNGMRPDYHLMHFNDAAKTPCGQVRRNMAKPEKSEEKSPTPPLNAKGLFETYEKDGKKITEILRFNAVEVFFAGFIPPLVGSVSAIAIALIFHNDEISNYNWQCVSRYKRLRNIHYTRTVLYEISRYAYFYVGLAELVFLSALSIVGERENIRELFPDCSLTLVGYEERCKKMHVIFFYIFGFCGIGHMLANIFCHAHSLYYINPYGRLSYYLKIIFSSLYILSAPVLVGAFILYWKQCITWAYDVFAICEYCGVFLNICFHGCAFFDIRYKVCFSVRHIEPVKNKEKEQPEPKKVSVDIELRNRAHGWRKIELVLINVALHYEHSTHIKKTEHA
ncbi:hypothetical protein ANCCEY_00801 [Ancylostoma ceylanicum]|uniref:CWH43-like N-terminal domain-containing protein n=1 Tax=Ancylostoma ceylanicum TaxID=53326 RepID=A0A0D6M9E5_9BILA|nr:hypothetical protein ANCCEY_00801 [Ancylostoma ceylanicum]